MSRFKLYYHVKPFIPWRIRMAVRRYFAHRKRKRYLDIWPISPTSATPPNNWLGWPDGKDFCFSLSHDIEGKRGLDRVRRVAELEMEYGFRSSFNFIPEGAYKVPKELRDWLVENGFEVGVHDLHHDGKLFASRESFRKSAKRINKYLKDWGAVGYRSGFMLRNLEWFHDLNILYDASTFDTDPFEPQPDGANTIFPFFVEKRPEHVDGQSISNSSPQTSDPNPQNREPNTTQNLHPSAFSLQPSNKAGYVELPYTLPQDSTLFLLFKEATSATWKRKLDWVASKGGMSFVNIHPDYLNFGKGPNKANEFSASIYADFLRYVSTQRANQYWHALPYEIAQWYKERLTEVRPSRTMDHSSPTKTPDNLRGKRAIVFLFSFYPADPRPRRAAEAMANAGMQVDMICLRRAETEPRQETINGVNVTRVSIKKRREGKLAYIWQYSAFFFACARRASIRSLSKRYHVVHAHNMPDFLVFAGLVPKLFGAKCILDLHDPMPELMEGIYNLSKNSLFVRILTLIEKVSIGFSNLAFTPNLAFKRLFVSRSCKEGKMQIVMNSPEHRIFNPDRFSDKEEAITNEFRIMHHGSIVHRHGVDLLVRAVAKVKETIPNATLEIYGGRTDFLDTVLEVAKELDIADSVHYHEPVSQEVIASEIRKCTVGIVPNRRSEFTEVNFPTRLFEYISMGRPVVAPSTEGIKDYFKDDEIIFFEPDDVDSLAQRILWVHENQSEARDIVERGKAVYRRHLWKEERAHLLGSVSSLFE